MHEVLGARRKDMTVEFNRGFSGMTEARDSTNSSPPARLHREVVGEMPAAHNFLTSFVRGKPDWTSIGLPGAANSPR